MPYVGRNSDPAIQQVLRDWAGWYRMLSRGQGWGVRGLDKDRIAPGPAPAGVHSDPTFAEYAASIEDGEGIYRFVDSRIREHYPVVQRLIRSRYVGLMTWSDIATAEGCSVDDCKVMHNRATGALSDEVRRYLHREHDRAALETYESLFGMRRSRERPRSWRECLP